MENESIITTPLLSSFEQSKELDQLFTALAKFQGEVENPKKNSKGAWGPYADFTEMRDCIRQPLAKYGLSYTQPPIVRGYNGELGIVTQINHSSGQWMRSVFILKPEKDSNQGIGGSISYIKRYCLGSSLGLATDEDNDGDPVISISQPKANVFNQDKPISDKQRALLLNKLKDKPSGTIGKVVERFHITKIEDLRMSIFNDVLAWIDGQ